MRARQKVRQIKETGSKDFTYCNISYNATNVKITNHNDSSSQSMKREDIGAVNFEYNEHLNLDESNYTFRWMGISVLAGIIPLIMFIFAGINESEGVLKKSWNIFLICCYSFIAGGLLLFVDIVWDTAFGTNLAFKFYSYFFGHKGYDIFINNKFGIEGIVCFAEKSEKSSVLKFIKKKKKEKKVVRETVAQKINPKESNSAASSSKVKQIQEFAELHKQGLITDEEFKAEKLKILKN